MLNFIPISNYLKIYPAPLFYSLSLFQLETFLMFWNSYLSSHVPAWTLIQALWDSWVCSLISFSVTRQIIFSGGPLTISISFLSFSGAGSSNFFVRKHKPGYGLSRAMEVLAGRTKQNNLYGKVKNGDMKANIMVL